MMYLVQLPFVVESASFPAKSGRRDIYGDYYNNNTFMCKTIVIVFIIFINTTQLFYAGRNVFPLVDDLIVLPLYRNRKRYNNCIRFLKMNISYYLFKLPCHSPLDYQRYERAISFTKMGFSFFMKNTFSIIKNASICFTLYLNSCGFFAR